MVKLLLVDDEEKIRKGIKNIINWEALGIEIYGEASNGYEALKLASSEPPDIILTDIKMPIMDGLQLIESLKKEAPGIKSIIMSGYDDFDYIQRAIKLGTSDYLLKPSGVQEIQDIVEKVKKQLIEERERELYLQNLMEQFNESFSVMKEKYLNSLLTSKGNQLEISAEKLEFYNINLREQFITVVLVRITDLYHINDRYDIEPMKFAVKNTVEENLRKNYNCEVCEYSDDIAAIINTSQPVEKGSLLSTLKEIKVTLERQFNYSVCFGMGTSYENLGNAHLSYGEAVMALEEKLLSSDDFIALYRKAYEEDIPMTSYPLEKEILNCIKSGSEESLVIKLDQYFKLLNRASISKKKYTALHSNKGMSKILKNAIKFIENNYYKDLNRKTVAEAVYVTPGYLSLLFKKEMNTSFIDYVHNIRIQRACELLKEIRYKTYDVAVMVGYSDEKYFFQVFKKYKGMTPMQYRNSFLDI